jgi:hypothetical protein
MHIPVMAVAEKSKIFQVAAAAMDPVLQVMA